MVPCVTWSSITMAYFRGSRCLVSTSEKSLVSMQYGRQRMRASVPLCARMYGTSSSTKSSSVLGCNSAFSYTILTHVQRSKKKSDVAIIIIKGLKIPLLCIPECCCSRCLSCLWEVRGARKLESYKVCHYATSCSRSCYYTSYGSYGNPLSYEVW